MRDEKIEKLSKIAPKNTEIVAISSITRKNIDELIKKIYAKLQTLPMSEPIVSEQSELEKMKNKQKTTTRGITGKKPNNKTLTTRPIDKIAAASYAFFFLKYPFNTFPLSAMFVGII